MAKKSAFTTLYESGEAGALAFAPNEAFQQEILGYLDLIGKLREDHADNPDIVQGLEEVESRLHSLRLSQDEETDLRGKLDALLQVPISPDKTLHLGAFRKTAQKNRLATEEDYQRQVRKLVRNTQTNITLLLLTKPDDTILQSFLQELKDVDPETEYRALKERMGRLGKSPQLWHYMEVKKAFLTEWLRPYQKYLGQAIEQMSPEEFNAALTRVEALRETRLEENTHLTMVEDRDPFRAHNRTMHPLMNGRKADFWGGTETRDEFVTLVNTVITRFTFNLEDRFLLFRTKEGSFQYLVGFADETFDNAVQLEDGRVGLYPHLKVFLRREEDGAYQEIVPESYSVTQTAYFRALKTAVVPFINAMAVMTETELSPNLKQAFDMWM